MTSFQIKRDQMIDEEYLNNSKKFYDETSIEIWKNILSEVSRFVNW